MIFFWFSFHQNGTSLSLFARDFVKTDSVAPEIWQALNPFYVIILTPVVMAIFAALARNEGWTDEKWEEELTATLAHEFTHHMEGLAGERGLEIQDEAFLEQYREERAQD